MNHDLTVGRADKVLWKFCLPLFASVIFQQIYNIADSLVAGKFIGENALAAVGNSYEITLIFIAIAMGSNIGCSIVVSQLFGAKEYGKVQTAIRTSFIGAGAVCALLMIPGILLSDSLLSAINTPAAIFGDSKLYLDIYIWGLPFVFFYNMATGVFSALGDSKTPFWFLAASSTCNIFADILFVKAFNMGVAGIAWATFICQGISCILAVIFVFRRISSIPAGDGAKWFSSRLLLKIARIAVPSMLQQSFVSVGNILLQGIINGYGPGVIAGYSAAIKLNNLVITSFNTLSNGISNFAAQNLGAGKYTRLREGFRAGLKLVWVISLPLALLYFFAGGPLIRFFIDNPTELAVETGVTILRMLSPFYFVISAKLVSDGILKGSGDMMLFMSTTLTDLFLRVFLAFIFSATALGAAGIWLAWPVGWGISTVMSVLLYRFSIKKRINN